MEFKRASLRELRIKALLEGHGQGSPFYFPLKKKKKNSGEMLPARFKENGPAWGRDSGERGLRPCPQ